MIHPFLFLSLSLSLCLSMCTFTFVFLFSKPFEMLSLNEPSELLSNARLTIATLIQRPSTVTTSNAFDEFSILDDLIDVSNDVDRFEGGESRKFLNIAQLITASTCIYSRRVDALYKLINAFQSSDQQSERSESSPILEQQEQEEEEEDIQPKKIVQEKKKKTKEQQQSFICQDLNKINLNPTKTFFLDRTSLLDLKLFQKYVPMGNKQFWINDNRPMIFELLFDDQLLDENNNYQQPERLIDVLNQSPQPEQPEQQPITFDSNDDIPLPIPAYDADDDREPSWNDENPSIEKKKLAKNHRKKKMQNDLDLNIFRQGLTDAQQALFRFQRFKPISTKTKPEQTKYFVKSFNRKHFNALIKDHPTVNQSILSIYIYPMITNHYLSIRERYSIKIYQPIRSPPVPISNALDDNLFDPLSPTFIDDIQEDMDTRFQTDMEQILDAAILNSHEEQEQNKVFVELRSSIQTYMTEHESIQQTNVDDLLETLDDHYSLPLIFSQLLHLCASTQRYLLHSTANDRLFIEKRIQ